MFRSMALVCLVFGIATQVAAQWNPEIPEATPVASRPATTISVNCGAGQSLQAAIDANQGPLDIQISGICNENVLIRDKDVSLRGTTKPSLDGIRGVRVAPPQPPALIVRGPVEGTIQDLSFSGNPGTAVSIRGANLMFTNCLFEGNAGTGLQLSLDSFVNATGLTFNGNIGRSILVNDSQFFCNGCDVTGNNFALFAQRGGIASLNDSVVSGGRGIAAVDGGSIADVDCVTIDTPHPCGINVSGIAAQGAGGGLAVLAGVGDFTGQVQAADQGTVELFGARQLMTNAAGQPNVADFFGRIAVALFSDPRTSIQSRVRSITAAHFAQVLLTDNTLLDGTVTVATSATKQIDPTVIVLPPR